MPFPLLVLELLSRALLPRQMAEQAADLGVVGGHPRPAPTGLPSPLWHLSLSECLLLDRVTTDSITWASLRHPRSAGLLHRALTPAASTQPSLVAPWHTQEPLWGHSSSWGTAAVSGSLGEGWVFGGKKK